jgi:uncharacterized protein YjaZ
MQKAQLKIGNKHLGQIFLYFDYDLKTTDQKKFVLKLVKQVRPIMGYGYAGYSHPKYLFDNLNRNIFGNDSQSVTKLNVSNKEIITTVIKAVKKANHKLPIDKLNVYVFPTFNNFIVQKMGGSMGFVAWKNTMLLFINPLKNWKHYVLGTILHEYNHSVVFQYHEWNSLLNKIVFEGWAEVFLEELYPTAPYKVGQTLDYKASRKYFLKIKTRLGSHSNELFDEVFFRNEKYPLWTGYSIGYWLVKKFRRKNPKMNWSQLVKVDPKNILK